MTVHQAQVHVDTAIADLVAAAKAEGYEMGFRAGEMKGTEKAMSVLSMGDAQKGITPDFKGELHHMLDRITLFRHMIATHDTRHSMLGEIIGDFAKLLGQEPSVAVEINTIRADHMVAGDEYEYVTGDWQLVKEVAVAQSGRLHIRTNVGEHFFDHRDSVRVRRRVGGG